MLGVALVNRLKQDKNIEEIFAVIRPNSSKKARISKDDRIRLIECDRSNYKILPKLVNANCDVFYHMVWPRTATYAENIDDMILKCDAVKTVIEAVGVASELGCQKFIGAGSQSEYGLPRNGCYSLNSECMPVRADGIFHLMAGQLAKMSAEQLGMRCIWMRIFSVYGINDRPNSMVQETIGKLLNGEHCSFTKSEQKWDYVYSDDVAEAFYLVGTLINEHNTYNIASGESKSLKEYVETIRDVVSPNAELGIGELDYPPNAIMNMEVDISTLTADTGWRPQIDFKSGIRRIYEDALKAKR